ncbi:MAG: hypothetical protein RBU35_08825 [Anaerolineae bacterium]|jgi:hypothetical protein|nr:hypothetical protein [Anaerolineae bacterium]
MTDCRKVRALLALPREDWSAEERRLVEDHLPGCQACSATARIYAEQDRLSRALPPAALISEQRTRLLARVRAEGGRAGSRRVSRLAGLAAAGVGLVLIGLLALLLSNLARQEPGPVAGGPSTPAATATASEAEAGVPAALVDLPSPTPEPSDVGPVEGPADGSGLGRVAYVQDGDLWVRELPDGEPVRLVGEAGPLAVSEPRWSPSGEWLAYRRDTAVWLIRANGQDAYAVDQGGVVNDFAWSPVEDRLAYVAGSGVLRLAVLRAGEAEALTLLPPDDGGFPGRFAWSPGGESIAYEWRQGMDAQDLRLIEAGQGAAHEPVVLYDSGFPRRGEALLAGWTGDGRYLLFWQGRMSSASLLADGAAFYALPAGGGEPVLLSGGDGVVLYYDDFWSSSPTGSVALAAGAGRETWTNKVIAVARPGEGEPSLVTAGDQAAVSPALSSLGVAYAAGPDAGSVGGGDAARAALFERRIWLALADGSAPRRLTGDEGVRDERPLWSADGSQVLFVRMDEGERVSLWLVPRDGGNPQPVAEGLGPWPGGQSGWFGSYGHLDWDALYDWWRGPAAPTAEPQPTAAPAPAQSTGSDVAGLLQNPPAPGEVVELDAYFSGAASGLMRGGPAPAQDQVVCPTHRTWAAALTDRPFPGALRLLNGTRSNALPADAAWLVATVPEAAQPGQLIIPDFPYHARFRGRLGDPVFAGCPDAERILVVEEVVAVYEEQAPEAAGGAWEPPAGYEAWPRYDDAAAGFSLPHPPDWTVETLAAGEEGVASAVALHGAQWPDYPVVVRVHEGEIHYDQYEPASLPPLLQGPSWGVYEQGIAFGQPVDEGQPLAGFSVEREGGAGEGRQAVLFSGSGRTYELELVYPTGFEASQPLLTAYSVMVEGFRLDTPPGPTATPPVKQELGPGPFLSEGEALARVRERDGQEVELLDAVLLPEAEARRRADACSTFGGHPDGVWLLTVRGTYEGRTRTLDLFLDATTGAQLCGEEVPPDPYAGWLTYIHPTYGFSFRYPAGWDPEPQTARSYPNIVRLVGPDEGRDVELTIGFRRADEEAPIQRTGTGAGDVEIEGTATFLGQRLTRNLLIYEGKVKSVMYNNAMEIAVDGMVFTLSLDVLGNALGDYEAADISPEVQAVADRIVASFVLPTGD